jgi:DNA mismatch endonuclease (patch repair protein)
MRDGVKDPGNLRVHRLCDATSKGYPLLMEVDTAVRQRMQKTSGRDNPFERSVRSGLFKRGVRYRIHYPIPEMKRMTCDIALPGRKVAIFLDGCFWHGCPIHPPSVKRNTEFWMEKIKRNRNRDARVSNHLTEMGWIVLRFWEHEKAATIVKTIVAALKEAPRRSSPHAGSSPLQRDQGSA